MDKYRRYYGVITFFVLVVLTVFVSVKLVVPKVTEYKELESQIADKTSELSQVQEKKQIVERKIRKIKNSISSSQKKVYSPVEADLGNETLFFTLYNDVIEMLHANTIKIKSIDYKYNPEEDAFVQFGKDVYFVCDINMQLVSNYINLGKLIQDIYQYPYYIKINNLEVKPYAKDKKILITDLSLRLYAHTSPEEQQEEAIDNVGKTTLSGADTALPQ